MNRAPYKSAGQRRLLGDARRETTAAVHLAASKRRRLAQTDEPDEPDDDINPTDTRALDDHDVAVFADAVYEPDDAEADQIYEKVQQRMESRRQKQREEVLQAEVKKYRDANPTLKQQFADLKDGLSQVSTDQWASIPDIGDYSVKKQKFQKFTPVPDSLLERARQEAAHVASEPAGGAATDLASIGAGRVSLLGQKLDTAGTSVSAQTSVNVGSYLTELSGVKVSSESEIGDIKKARLLLKSVTATNPKHAPGWIASARLEETAGRISDARTIILEGCSTCPREEDVWVEAARMFPPETSKRLLAKAVRMVPRSPKIWLQAANLEEKKSSKRRVLRKALEIIPTNEELWKAAVELEDPNGARILLSRAVECVPSATDLWLALARLETYERAQEILGEARQAVPEEAAVWITAAQLEEVQNGAESEEIFNLLKEGVKILSVDADVVKRERWFEEAVNSDKSGYSGTVKGIVTNAISLGINFSQRASQWLSDAQDLESKGCMKATEHVYDHLTQTFQTRENLWISYADFQRRRGEQGGPQRVLRKALRHCPRAVTLWLMLAKDEWKTGPGGADSAREVLRKAFEVNANSEDVWLAAAKVETENGCYERARSLLAKARSEAPSARVYMKSALLERLLQKRDEEKLMLESGIGRYPNVEKLWLMLAQWHERGPQENGDVSMHSTDGISVCANGGSDEILNKLDKDTAWVRELKNPREVYVKAIEKCGKSVNIWVGYGRLEERLTSVPRARAVLERGRESCKNVGQKDVLWRESIYLEVRHGNQHAARLMLARGMQECGKSGKLWALSILLEDKAGQKSRSVEAIKRCGEDACVLTEVGRYLWRAGKNDKARTWLKKAVEVDAEYGDGWGSLLAFVKECGDEDERQKVEKEAVRAEPRFGDAWIAVSKRIGHETMGTLQILRHVVELCGKDGNVTGLL